MHAELSGGSVAAFWALAGREGVARTATLHDPPRPVWFPFLSRIVGRSRILVHGVHRPTSKAVLALERRVMRDVDLVVLSSNGEQALRSLRMGASVRRSSLLMPTANPIIPAGSRPLAVGLFGHVYGGKGFELLPQLRRHLDPRIAIRVAGRGTERLPHVDGVEILGEVDGRALEEFFASIRLLLLPYDKQPLGGVLPQPASAAQLVAAAYGTPTLALATARVPDLEASGGCRLVAGSIVDLAAEAARIVGAPQEMEQMLAGLERFRSSLSVEPALAPYLALWAAE